ncbi:RES family NAD+ phosphorylase [Terribacillus sp. FSL K6-0262]|uniref:RES family NAD+ phosphorylase n=1 Tax=Terribacillus sp. FSL K6-0262 TaxID=2921447 RepID=UPI0030ED6A0D
MNCCINCINNKQISYEIIKLNLIGDCSFCEGKDLNICDIKSSIFAYPKRLILRLNKSDSGFRIQRFLTKQINLFNPELPQEVIDNLIIHMTGGLRNLEDLQGNFAVPYHLSSLVGEWKNFKDAVKYSNRFGFGISERLSEALRYILIENKYTLTKNEHYFRARLGYDKIKVEQRHGYPGEQVVTIKDMEVAFSGDKIMAPPSHLVNEGRLNPRGISYLYVAENDITAIAEVRPHKHKKVSVANVKTNDTLEVSCFDNRTFFEKPTLSEQLDFYLLTNFLNSEFSKPIDEDTRYLDYLPTQYVSELAKNLKIEGIRYSSSLEDGFNICIFNTEKVEFVESDIAKISSVKLEIERSNTYEYKVINGGQL